MKICRRSLLTATVGLTAAAVLGRPSFAQSDAIRIGVGSDPSYSAFYLAAHEKLFAAEGVKAELQTFTGGGDTLDAVIAGQVDMGGTSEPTTMIRMSRAQSLRPLAVFYQSGNVVKMVVGKDVANPSDIRNFGVVAGSISEYCTSLAIAKLKLDQGAIKLVPAGPPEMPALLARGDIDAYFAWEPWPGMGVQQGGKLLLTSADVGYVGTQWITASDSVLKSNAEGCRKVLAALAKASDIVQSDPKRAAAAVKAMTRIPEDTTLKMLSILTAKIRDFNDEEYKSFDSIAQFLADKKLTNGLVPYREFLQHGFFKA